MRVFQIWKKRNDDGKIDKCELPVGSSQIMVSKKRHIHL